MPYKYLEVSPTGRTLCKVCYKFVAKGTLRVTKKRFYNSTFYYHLDCFRPAILAPIKSDYFTVNLVKEQKYLDEVAAWVNNWNKQFVTSEEEVPSQYLAKAVHTFPTVARRRFIEIFAFLTVHEVETLAALTCREWFHVTRDQELWKEYFVRQFLPSNTDERADYRCKCIAHHLGACVGCNRILTQDQIARKCEFYNRLICSMCNSQPKFAIYSLNNAIVEASVTSATLKLLEVPTFIVNKRESTYVKILLEKVIPYAEKRMRLLLELLQTTYSDRIRSNEVAEIATVNIADFYEKLYHRRGRNWVSMIVWQAFVFCGKCEKGEKIEKSIEAFFQKIEYIRVPSQG